MPECTGNLIEAYECLNKMIDWGGEAIFEARADWLAVETLYIAEHLGLPIEEEFAPNLIRKIRVVFKE